MLDEMDTAGGEDQATQTPSSQPAAESEAGDKSSEAPPAVATSPVETRADDGPLVPRKALEDERKKRQEYERQLGELQRQMQPRTDPRQRQQSLPPEPPDPFVDPQGYASWVTQAAVLHAQAQAQKQVEFVVLNRELNRSERRARKEYGDDKVDKAVSAALETGQDRKFIHSDDPYADLMSWYESYRLATNPDEARASIEAEILAKYGLSPTTAAPAAYALKQKAPAPRSLASAGSAQPRDDRGRWTGPTPLEELID
jgi:hypothetical protein